MDQSINPPYSTITMITVTRYEPMQLKKNIRKPTKIIISNITLKSTGDHNTPESPMKQWKYKDLPSAKTKLN